MAKSIRSPRHRALLAVLVASRRHAGLTQKELATLMKWTQSKVAQIESGQRQVYVSELFEFAKVLKVDPVDLFRRVSQW
jgi:transcriptional regulator with XRE-family HTH domain